MIQYAKKKIVERWIDRSMIEAEDRELYEYGIEITIETILNVITTILIIILTKEFISGIVLYVSFMQLRPYAGGIHANTFKKCYICSATIITVTLLLIRYNVVEISVYRCLSLAALIYMFMFQSVESENRKVSEDERKVFTKKEKVILICILIGIIFANYRGYVKIEKGLESTCIITAAGMLAGIVNARGRSSGKDNLEEITETKQEEKMITVAVCDDDKCIVEHLKKYIEKISEELGVKSTVDRFWTPQELDIVMEYDGHFDIIFMDVEFANVNGIEMAAKIQKNHEDIIFIFVTGYIEYVQRAFNVKTMGYVLKPYEYDSIKECFKRALNKIEHTGYVSIQWNKHFIKINTNHIMYIHSEGRKLQFVCKNGKEYWEYEKLDNLEEKLLNENNFIRIHKSYLVNFDYVKMYDFKKVIIDRGEDIQDPEKRMVEINVSRGYANKVRQKYLFLK